MLRLPFRASQLAQSWVCTGDDTLMFHILRWQAAPARLLFDPPAFKAEKLTVVYLNGAIPLEPLPLAARRYTLTHSDLSGDLLLSVGRQYNQGQLSGATTAQHLSSLSAG